MIRGLLVGLSLVVTGGASLQLLEETQYRQLASATVGALLGAADSTATGVVLIFQPGECFGDGAGIQQWSAIHAAGRIPVRARVVGDGTLSEEQERLFTDLAISIPVAGISARDAAVVAERLGYTSTPFALVLDRLGRVVATLPGERSVPPDVLERMYAGAENNVRRLRDSAARGEVR